MRNRSNQTKDQKGYVAIVLAAGLTALMGVSALAVDLGYMHMKSSDLQTAADSGALAGAAALISNRGDSAAIKAEALMYMRNNLRSDDKPTLAATSGDVVLLQDGVAGGWEPNQIEVTVRRTGERGNPVGLFFGRAVGTPVAELDATSRAALVPIGSSACAKPFMVPTKFEWDDFCAAGTAKAGNGVMDVNTPCEVASVNVLGYSEADVGSQILLHYGNPSDTMVPGQYASVDFPPINKGTPVTGADEYKDNISGCTGSNRSAVSLGDEIALEPGNMGGPTNQGVVKLLNEDPYAYWDCSTQSIQGSVYPDPMASPRVAIMAFYDPRQPPSSGRNSLFVHQMGAVFVEGTSGLGEVNARFIRAVARSPEPVYDSSAGNFLFTTRLVLDSSRGATTN
jgi:Flp pilus assembly protein TadG